jgi:hypothetical protein
LLAHIPCHKRFLQLFHRELWYQAAVDPPLLQQVLLEQHGDLAAIQQRQPHTGHKALYARVLRLLYLLLLLLLLLCGELLLLLLCVLPDRLPACTWACCC